MITLAISHVKQHMVYIICTWNPWNIWWAGYPRTLNCESAGLVTSTHFACIENLHGSYDILPVDSHRLYICPCVIASGCKANTVINTTFR